MTTDLARLELECTPTQIRQIKRRAAKAGYRGRAWAQWARAVLLGKSLRDTPMPKGRYVTVRQAAEICGISRQQMYVRIKNGVLECIDTPQGKMVRKAALRA